LTRRHHMRRLTLGMLALALGAAPYAAASSSTQPALRIAFAGTHTDAIIAPPMARPLVRGRLSGVQQPAGAQVTLIEQTRSGHPQIVRVASANARGTFSVRLPPARTRSVFAVYGSLTSNALTEREAVWVQLRVDRHAIRAAHSVRFRGSLPNAQGIRLLVALQVKRSHGYETFDILRSNTRGEFGGRFPLTIRGAHYHFRAYVPRQVGLALEPGASGSVEVTVT
jgi:hypothetical protein